MCGLIKYGFFVVAVFWHNFGVPWFWISVSIVLESGDALHWILFLIFSLSRFFVLYIVGFYVVFSGVWLLNQQNWPISQIPQCTCPTSHNAPLWNRNVHISVPKWCIVGYGTGALWDLWDRSFCYPCLYYLVKVMQKNSEQHKGIDFFLVLNLDWWNQTWPVVYNSRDLIQTNYISNARTLEMQ